jgi:hypothetical protein
MPVRFFLIMGCAIIAGAITALIRHWDLEHLPFTVFAVVCYSLGGVLLGSAIAFLIEEPKRFVVATCIGLLLMAMFLGPVSWLANGRFALGDTQQLINGIVLSVLFGNAVAGMAFYKRVLRQQ